MSAKLSRIVSRANEIFIAAKMCGWNQQKILDVLNRDVYPLLLEKMPAGRNVFTASQKGYIGGYIAAKFDTVVKHETAYYYNIDGKLYAAHRYDVTEQIPHYSDIYGAEYIVGGHCGGIYWKNTDKKYS